MIWILFKIIIAVILTEALTQIITKSLIFIPVRRWFFDRKNNKFFEFIHNILDCGYCMSVWIGIGASLFLLNDVRIVSVFIDWFVLGIMVHRLSNVFHFVVDRLGVENEDL